MKIALFSILATGSLVVAFASLTVGSEPSFADSHVAAAAVASGANSSFPVRGTKKDVVEKRFGQPQRTGEPIGSPPISRWDYDKFSVYFEFDRVIHSVMQGPDQKP